MARNPYNRPGARRRGFTLVELMLVIGLLTVLLSVLMPLLIAANRRAQAHQCADNLRQAVAALAAYADLADAAYPLTAAPYTTELHRSWADASRSSMATYVELVGDLDNLYCPTFWHVEDPGRRHAVPAAYRPGQPLTWGYSKWAGTLDTRPFTARADYYSRYRDIGLVTERAALPFGQAGYRSVRRVSAAVRKYVVLGNSSGHVLGWQNARSPYAVATVGGPTPIPPAAIALIADTNIVNEVSAITSSHVLSPPTARQPWIPPQLLGINEAMADGHVDWHPIEGGALYYISDRQVGGGGVFVQDNR